MIRILVRNWWLLALRGGFALLFGLAAFSLRYEIAAPFLRAVAFTALVVIFALMAFVSGAFTPDGLLWFTALCMSIPALMARTRQHGALFDGLWLGFLHPILWAYFLENFTPIYIAYVIFVRFGMIVRKALVAFKEGYSGIDRYGQDAQPNPDALNR